MSTLTNNDTEKNIPTTANECQYNLMRINALNTVDRVLSKCKPFGTIHGYNTASSFLNTNSGSLPNIINTSNATTTTTTTPGGNISSYINTVSHNSNNISLSSNSTSSHSTINECIHLVKKCSNELQFYISDQRMSRLKEMLILCERWLNRFIDANNNLSGNPIRIATMGDHLKIIGQREKILEWKD